MMAAATRVQVPKGEARLETSALPLTSEFLPFPVHTHFLSTSSGGAELPGLVLYTRLPAT